MTSANQSIGQLLRQARQSAGLTQAEASKASGISQGNISDYERGVLANPSLLILLALSSAYGTTVSKLTMGLAQPETNRLHLRASKGRCDL